MSNLKEKVLNLSEEELKELAKEGRRIYAKEYRKRKKETLKRNSDLHFACKALAEKGEAN